MNANRNVAVFVGSLRKQSFNRKVALALAELAPAGLKLEIVEIGHLPHYNADDEGPVDILKDPGEREAEALSPSQETALRTRFGIGETNHGSDIISPLRAWTALRQQIKAADAVLFVTPEYNRSVPGVLKNAIDIASRPFGQSAWDGKPSAVISVSPGAMGGFGANHHLRQSLVFLNMPAMQQPEAYIGGVDKLFDKASGKLTNDSTRGFLSKFLQAFAAWIEIHAKPR